MQRRRKRRVRNALAVLAVISLPVGLAALTAGSAAQASTATASTAPTATTSSLGSFSPTFTGPAATGCSSAGCQLLSGPIRTASTANVSSAANSASASASRSLASEASAGTAQPGAHQIPYLLPQRPGPDPTPPTASCQPTGPGCSPVSTSSGGAVGVKGLNAVDSGTLPTNPNGDIEPSDQGLCAGNGYVVEDNNIGEIMVFNSALHRRSGAISLDTMMGLTQQGWSSGGDIMCNYDYSNGGHWFFTEIVSESTEA